MTSTEIAYRGAPQAVIAEIIRLRDESGGEITERMVVDAASDPASPLHDRFVWDNELAADGFRIVQARLLINSVKIHIMEGESVRIMPAFVSITNGDGKRVRIGSERAVSDPGLLGQVMAETRTQIRGLRNRLSAFDEAQHVVTQLDDVLKTLPTT
jgi:hypothetical protein